MRLILATSATFLGTALVLTAAPANDAFANRIQLIGTNLVVLAGSDDADPQGGIRTSEVTFDAAAGQTYAIAESQGRSVPYLDTPGDPVE